MARKKLSSVKMKVDLKLKAYSIVSDAVDGAISYGLNRAHKHMDTPTSVDIHEAVLTAVMGSLCDIIDFGD